MQNGPNHPPYESSYCSIDIDQLLAFLKKRLENLYREVKSSQTLIEGLSRLLYPIQPSDSIFTVDELQRTVINNYQEIEHFEQQIVYLEKGCLTIKLLDDGSQFIPFFPTHIVKTLDGRIGTIFRSTADSASIHITDGTRYVCGTEELQHQHGFAKQSGPVEPRVAAFAQARNQDSCESSDEGSNEESRRDPDLAELIRLVNEGNGDAEHDQFNKNESESDYEEYENQYGNESDN